MKYDSQQLDEKLEHLKSKGILIDRERLQTLLMQGYSVEQISLLKESGSDSRELLNENA